MIIEKYDLVIIGAGFCGLAIGKALTRSSINFKIVEKSKAFGGRAATRRFLGQAVDHGAQYFTMSHQNFLNWVEELEEEDIVRPWTNHLHAWNGQNFFLEEKPLTRYICPLGMTSMAKKLANVLPVSREIKIIKVEYASNLWHLSTNENRKIQASKIISTIPLPQSLELFSEYLNSEQKEKLTNITYNACLCGIFVYPLTFKPNWKGIFWNSGNILSWVCHDSSKRDEPNHTIIVAHCKPEFSSKYFNASEEEVLNLILKEISVILPAPKLQEMQLKKWLYAQPQTLFGQNHLKVDKNLYLTGDWCLSPNLEGAFLTGLQLAKEFN